MNHRLNKHSLCSLLALTFITAACGVREAGTTQQTQPTIPVAGPSNGWVAFAAVDGLVSTAGGNGPADIYIVPEDQPVRPLVGSEGDGRHQFCPAFSPDGSRLAYVDMPFGPNAPPGPRGIVIVGFDAEQDPRAKTRIEVEGSDEAIVGNFNLSCPKWSPDGSKLAYLENDKLQVATLGAEAPSTVCLTCACSSLSDCRADHFAWSPDGSVIAVSRTVGIALIPVDGSEWRRLPLKRPNAGTSISWSRDGIQLVVDGSAVKVVGVDGTEHDLSPDGESPIWSPDGSRIAYLVWDRSQGTSTLVVSLPDGSGRRELPVPDPHLPARHPLRSGDWRPGFATGIASVPIWSPDSKRLLYVAVGVDGNSLVSVSAIDNAPPMFLTSFDSLLYNTGSSWLSWQPLFP